MVAAIIGWFFLGLACLLVLLLVLPVTITARLEHGDFTVKVRVFFIRLTVFPLKPRKPRKPKKEKAKKPGPDTDEAEEEKEPKKKRTLGEMVTFVKRLAQAGIAAMKVFFRHLRIRNVSIVLPVHAEEAGDTAIRCGQLHALLGTARAVLDSHLHVSWRRLQLIPDFAGQHKDDMLLSAQLVFCPGIALVMGGVFLKHFLASRPKKRRPARQKPPPAPEKAAT